jgi:hypothetical protein
MLNISTMFSAGDSRWREASVEILGLDNLLTRLDATWQYAHNPVMWGEEYSGRVVKKLSSATRTWKTRVEFRTRVLSEGSGSARISVGTSSAIFAYVNEGTRAHWIRPKRRDGVLAFNSKFSPKSRPNNLQALKGFSGPPVGFAKAVWHPGTEARHFDEVAMRQAQTEGSRAVRAEINRRWGG